MTYATDPKVFVLCSSSVDCCQCRLKLQGVRRRNEPVATGFVGIVMAYSSSFRAVLADFDQTGSLQLHSLIWALGQCFLVKLKEVVWKVDL